MHPVSFLMPLLTSAEFFFSEFFNKESGGIFNASPGCNLRLFTVFDSLIKNGKHVCQTCVVKIIPLVNKWMELGKDMLMAGA